MLKQEKQRTSTVKVVDKNTVKYLVFFVRKIYLCSEKNNSH